MSPTNRLGQTSQFSRTRQHGPWPMAHRKTIQCLPATHVPARVCTRRAAHTSRRRDPHCPSVQTLICVHQRMQLSKKNPKRETSGPNHLCFLWILQSHPFAGVRGTEERPVTQALWEVCPTIFHREVAVVKHDRLACNHT